MALFSGTFTNKVDRKGRVSLPADFRCELPESDHRLVYIYPAPKLGALEACDKVQLQRIADAIEMQEPLYSTSEMDLNNMFLSQARRANIDETGRLVLSPEHMEHAGITDRAVFVGAGSRFLIWSPDRHQAHKEDSDGRSGDLTLKLPPKERRYDA